MNKLQKHLKILDSIIVLLTSQKMEPTKYFFTSMFFRRNDLDYYSAYEIGRWWKKYIERKENGRIKDKLNLYVHIPFCETRCTFCRFPLTTYYNKRIVRGYLEGISREMRYFKNIFSSQYFDNIYIGGGSPNVLNLQEIRFLSKSIFGNFKFSPHGERTFECTPWNSDPKKLKLLRRSGFNRVSIGVESLDKKVLKYANRRHQTLDSVKKIISDAQDYGFIVNVDLMFGLYEETPSGIEDTFSKVINLRPHRVSIYPLKPSENYLNAFFGGKENAFFLFLKNNIAKTFEKIRKIAILNNYSCPGAIGLNEGYSINFDKFTENIEKGGYYTRELNDSTLGFGSFAVSKIALTARYQNNAGIKDIFSLSKKYYRGAFSLPKDDMRDYILDFFSKGVPVYRDRFINIFGKDPVDVFDYTFSALKKLRKIEITKEYVKFLPSARKEMFKYGLLFWDVKELMKVYNN